jgi:hypothetical protein
MLCDMDYRNVNNLYYSVIFESKHY